ncbi:MAG: translation initiation factor IF-2 subunit beta [Candidatus Aenigmarchaeota archaeon]|nr:translation initiation factor IF-2 subunit beta [Candidatus Aenigmarchaeota archaeon]
MQSYEELLKRALDRLPKTEEKGRWELPEPAVQIAGKRTTVKNFADLCKYMRRDQNSVAKYLYRELAVPGSVDKGQLFLQGKFSADAIRKRMGYYVKEFVLCAECGKPDTDIVKVGRIHMLKCQACGVMRSVEGK